MTLEIKAPEVERRIREVAAARKMEAEDYLVELVTSQLPSDVRTEIKFEHTRTQSHLTTLRGASPH
ncbi:MAG TPA: hypothetical protein VFJ58_04745 [Armatimonadota bacterium]|nr:hypothetical protein [Armatimonadota bacterium]